MKIEKKQLFIYCGILLIGGVIGFIIHSSTHQEIHSSTHHDINASIHQYTCSMHPSVRQNEPGKCPLCGMDLIPLSTDSDEDNPMEIRMSQAAIKLANIQTSLISKQKPMKEIRLHGKVQANEQLVYSQTSHIGGRIEKLLVTYTGEFVKKGQEIAYVYSPELVTAQEELFEAYKIRDTQAALYNAAREKLKNWKLTDQQIEDIIQAGTPSDQFPILSDISGVVITKRVNLGDHIMEGSSLYEIADLSSLWILFDVYESDMAWIHVGDEVEYSIQSLPGETFKAKISFIDPTINSKTRVAKARISVRNRGMRLKPEMFASGLIKSSPKKGENSIIVPKSAVMWTGKRSVVYVKTSSDVGISFMMREVTLGPSLGERYVITDGLEEGEEIATHGTFSIDAAAQLAGKPSMMSPASSAGRPAGGAVMTGHHHGTSGETGQSAQNLELIQIDLNAEAKQALVPLVDAYLDLKTALVNDDFELAKSEGTKFLQQLKRIKMSMFEGDVHNVWMQHSMPAEKAITELVKATDIASARIPFKPLSEHMIQLAKRFDPFEKPLFIQHCPMADDFKGADWLSTEENIMNPYFGESMLTCGNVKDKIE